MKQFLLYNFASADILAFSVIEFVDKSVMTRFLDMIFLQKNYFYKIKFTLWIGLEQGLYVV